MKPWSPRQLTAAQKEERRLEAARLLKEQRLSQAAIARHLGVSRAAVTHWTQQLSAAGGDPHALHRHRAPGRPPKISAADWEQVLSWLRAGARAAGYPTERWTLPRMVRLIEQRLGIHYHRRTLAVRVHRSGWSVQRPVYRAVERDDALVQAWLEHDWPRIKKECSRTSGDRVRR